MRVEENLLHVVYEFGHGFGRSFVSPFFQNQYSLTLFGEFERCL